ncbi:hypothetical protein JTE90_026928 [Oedothorax gibbosus]|uniref:Uncharacterized protein n=1 Tax=Oedothorax gibbosus TaxID=931172 RepID=A0AAV6TWT2_9ARAC|nr:hypothetical protein JTE90_026928 [Oedothorax gibbosus]
MIVMLLVFPEHLRTWDTWAIIFTQSRFLNGVYDHVLVGKQPLLFEQGVLRGNRVNSVFHCEPTLPCKKSFAEKAAVRTPQRQD